ncbi:MAG TPA: ABC transporter permease subunit [Lacipirellulaceae bacterium]|jgi:iron(III) transport system permease protein
MPKRRLPPKSWLFAVLFLGVAAATFSQLDLRVGRLLLSTAWLVAGVELLALPLGVLLAVALTKTDVPGRRAAKLLITAMLFLPLYMFTGAWDAGFGIQGWHTLATNPHLAREPWLSGWRAAVWIHALSAVPWVVLIVAAGLRTVEAELEEDAVLRMPAYQVLRRVTLRRAGGAIVIAAVWVAMVTSAEISVTDVYQVRTFAEEVYTQAALGAFDFSPSDSATLAAASQAAARAATAAKDALPGKTMGGDPALSLRSLWYGLALSAMLVIGALLAASLLCDDLVHAPERRPWIWHLRTGRWPAAVALWSCMFVVAGIPLANLIYKAGLLVESTDAGRVRSWSATKVVAGIATAPWQYRDELAQSAEIGAAAAMAALLLGVPLAWSMRGTSSLPWLRLGLIALLMAVPGPLLGIGLIRLLNQPTDSRLASLGWLYDTNFAPWLVQTLRALPVVTLILWPTLASVPQSMLDTAATDGAGWWRRLLFIVIPQRGSALVAAWLVALAVAVGELAATVLVVPPGPTTISVRIFSLIHYGVDDRVASICLVLVLGLAAVTLVSVRLLPLEERDVALIAGDSVE